MPLLRLFVAIEIPPAIREAIAGSLALFKGDKSTVKWERTEKLHVTLRFIGDTVDENIPQVIDALQRAAAHVGGPYPVRYSSSGFFPNRHRPRILWVGMDDPGRMTTSLHDRIEIELRSLGLDEDDKKFHPHVTVGRIRHESPPSRLLGAFEKLTLHTDQVIVDQFVLMKSELSSDGSQYSVVERFPFGGNTA